MYDVWPMRRTNIYLPDEQLEALRQLGEQRDQPVAELVRQAVDAWLEAQGVEVIGEDEWASRFGALGGPRLRVVVDTNVWVSGLMLPDGAPGRVLDAARRGFFTPLASWDLAEEIVDVLRRPRLRRYRITEDNIRD